MLLTKCLFSERAPSQTESTKEEGEEEGNFFSFSHCTFVVSSSHCGGGISFACENYII